jgi:hypothetical protein
MLLAYPESRPLFAGVSIGYAIVYVLMSIYRTLVPVDEASLRQKDNYLPSK